MKQIIFFIGMLLLSININSQSKKFIIIVKDVNNKPVSNALILLDNKKQETLTSLNGVFKAKLDYSPKKISAFHPNIGIAKVKYNGESIVKMIIKKGKGKSLNNNKSNQISGETIQINSIYDYLRGRVSGVNVGANNVITIRGYNSIQGNTTPLFILNGSQISQDIFGRINPVEVERVTVLKGSDTAVYGIRGANGVIVVVTK